MFDLSLRLLYSAMLYPQWRVSVILYSRFDIIKLLLIIIKLLLLPIAASAAVLKALMLELELLWDINVSLSRVPPISLCYLLVIIY